MALELSITLGETLNNINTIEADDPLMNASISSHSSGSGTCLLESCTSDSLETDYNNVLAIPLQTSPRFLEEEDDANRNVILPLSSTSTELTSSAETNKDIKSGQCQFASDLNSNINNSKDKKSLTENHETVISHIGTSSAKPVVVPEQISTPKSGNMLSRNPSFQGPMITNIRIGTPVRKSTSTDQASQTMPSEVEYTISVTNQNSLKLEMTASPTLCRVAGNTNCSCTGTPEKKLLENNIAAGVSELDYPTHDILISNQTVRLRTKKSSNRNCGAKSLSYPSQTDEMKRHSVEITQLRHALEQKIACQGSLYKSNDHDSPCEIKRPLSAFGYSSHYNSPVKENMSSCDGNVRKSLSYTSSPVHWQNQSRNIDHVEESKKLRFLLEDHQGSSDQYASNLYNEYKHVIESVDHRITDPKNHHKSCCSKRNNTINDHPYTHQRSSTPLSDCEDNIDSQYSTPLGSPRPGSQRSSKKKNHGDAKTIPEGPVVGDDGRVNYYPNCDATIWIRTCQQEVTQPLSGVQSGKIPLWLAGTLIRNGPGRLQVGDSKYNHLFDGSALLHGFHFKKGHVTYQNRFLKSKSYLRDTKAQRIVSNYFATKGHPDPCRTILQNIASKFDFEEHFADNAQISLYPYGDGLYALTETPHIFRIDPENLETHEKVDLSKYLSLINHTAHPHVDTDGTVYNIGQGVGPMGPKYQVCKFPNPKADKKGKIKSPFDQAQIVGSVNARWRWNPCYMHSFGMTENYWIIIEQPLVVCVRKVLMVILDLKDDALIDAMQWWEKETKIHVLSRATGSTINTQYVTETFFFLHTINAYEDKGHIILDIATYKNAEMLHCMYVDALKNASYDPTYAQMFRGRPKRWVIPLRPNKDASVGTNLVTLPDTKCQGRWLKKNVVYLTPELLTDIGCEVPRIYYEKYNGRPYRYFYAICSDVDHPSPGTLVKCDVVNKTHVEWSEDNIYPSEPIFIPHPLAKNEDDGVVLSSILRAKGLDNQVCLVILDAATFRLRARVEFVSSGPVPKCLHGWFVHEGTLKVHQEESKQKTSKTDC